MDIGTLQKKLNILIYQRANVPTYQLINLQTYQHTIGRWYLTKNATSQFIICIYMYKYKDGKLVRFMLQKTHTGIVRGKDNY